MFKVGIGYDIHRLVPGRKLVLAGVEIPFAKGLSAHSDGDVLAHAICDALLGASGLADIGIQFPNRDSRYKGISSLKLLKQVKDKINRLGLKICNVDSALIMDKPKIQPYRQLMLENLSSALGIAMDAVNIKVTPSEGVGQVGSKAIAAYAVVLVEKGKKTGK